VWVPLAAFVAGCWLRLEQPVSGAARVVVLLVLALVPAVASRALARGVLAIAAALVAAAVAADRLTPRGLWDRADDGLRSFYALTVPFDPHLHAEMHALVLFAIFTFALGLALTIAARRPLAACVVLAAGAAWPTTLLGGSGVLARGVILLAGCLLLLGALGPRTAPRPALATGALLVLAAVAASAAAAVTPGGIVDWQRWNPYAAGDQVSVAYIWRSQYRGIHFPSRPTTVFEVQAPAEARYWRATTLDRFENGVWDEALTVNLARPVGDRSVLTNDETLPRRADDPSRWVRQRFFVRALADDHLPAAATPVAYASGEASQLYADGGVALRPGGLHVDDIYTAWSYAPSPKPQALARLGAAYPATLSRYLAVWGDETVPAFGAHGRPAALAHLFASDPSARSYRPLYRAAVRVVGNARTPYGAAVALETWFRSSGGFTYDEQPPQARGVPPLVGFVTTTHDGYCQHFAGAMALMLRYLGIPARVAAGFTSGHWDTSTKRWVVSDRDAHAWVEVWFPGYGWLPFDPTPSRGTLDAPYSDASASFDAGAAATAFAGGGFGLGLQAILKLAREHGRGPVLPPDPAPPALSQGGGSSLPWVAVAAALLAVATALALVAFAKAARRRLRYTTADPRRVAAACRRELEELAADQGVVIPRSAGPTEAAALVEERLGVDARRVARAVAEARFGPPARAGMAAAQARRELAAFRRSLREHLTLGRRLRGALSLRSL
jgi:transglutaminase-like putative cysteine protease